MCIHISADWLEHLKHKNRDPPILTKWIFKAYFLSTLFEKKNWLIFQAGFEHLSTSTALQDSVNTPYVTTHLSIIYRVHSRLLKCPQRYNITQHLASTHLYKPQLWLSESRLPHSHHSPPWPWGWAFTEQKHTSSTQWGQFPQGHKTPLRSHFFWEVFCFLLPSRQLHVLPLGCHSAFACLDNCTHHTSSWMPGYLLHTRF